jgi:hypothetical protein
MGEDAAMRLRAHWRLEPGPHLRRRLRRARRKGTRPKIHESLNPGTLARGVGIQRLRTWTTACRCRRSQGAIFCSRTPTKNMCRQCWPISMIPMSRRSTPCFVPGCRRKSLRRSPISRKKVRLPGLVRPVVGTACGRGRKMLPRLMGWMRRQRSRGGRHAQRFRSVVPPLLDALLRESPP